MSAPTMLKVALSRGPAMGGSRQRGWQWVDGDGKMARKMAQEGSRG